MKSILLGLSVATLTIGSAFAQGARPATSTAVGKRGNVEATRSADAKRAAEISRQNVTIQATKGNDLVGVRNVSFLKALNSTQYVQNNVVIPAKLEAVSQNVIKSIVGPEALMEMIKGQSYEAHKFAATFKANLSNPSNALYRSLLAQLVLIHNNPSVVGVSGNKLQLVKDMAKNSLIMTTLKMGTEPVLRTQEMDTVDLVYGEGLLPSFASKGQSLFEVFRTFENLEGMSLMMARAVSNVRQGDSLINARIEAMERHLDGQETARRVAQCKRG